MASEVQETAVVKNTGNSKSKQEKNTEELGKIFKQKIFYILNCVDQNMQ